MNIEHLDIVYIKYFNSRDAAEHFIERHKKQDCFTLRFHYWPLAWSVTKTKPAIQ